MVTNPGLEGSLDPVAPGDLATTVLGTVSSAWIRCVAVLAVLVTSAPIWAAAGDTPGCSTEQPCGYGEGPCSSPGEYGQDCAANLQCSVNGGGYFGQSAGTDMCVPGLGIYPWPDGIIPWYFDDDAYSYCDASIPDDPIHGVECTDDPSVCGSGATCTVRQFNGNMKSMIRQGMTKWETATNGAIQFEECQKAPVDTCPPKALRVHFDPDTFCSYGAGKEGHKPSCRWNTTTGSLPSAEGSILHELGHAVGLWHEQNRADADDWLHAIVDHTAPSCSTDAACEDSWNGLHHREAVCVHGQCRFLLAEPFDDDYAWLLNTKGPGWQPMLGNYDFDSALHYASRYDGGPGGEDLFQWTDPFGRVFNKNMAATVVPTPRDASRVLQIYAREVHPNWGFFRSLAVPQPDALPDPFLEPGVEAVGSPAIAVQAPGKFDVFIRGSNHRLYWKRFRGWTDQGEWISLGGQVDADPAAVSPEDGHVIVASVGRVSNRVTYKRLVDDVPTDWFFPPGSEAISVKETQTGGHLGPAVSSLNADRWTFWVTQSDGSLAWITLDRQSDPNGSDYPWLEWQTSGPLSISTQPAAISIGTQVEVALNRGSRLYVHHAIRVSPTGLYHLWTAGLDYGNEIATGSAPAIASRGSTSRPFRLLIVNDAGRLSHRFADSSTWRDIGGIPKSQTRPAVAQMGGFGAVILMNGEDATGAHTACISPNQPHGFPNPPACGSDTYIQPGGMWIRELY